MFKNALWKNPVGWAEKAVGTKLRFWIMITAHLVMGVAFVFFFLCVTFILFAKGFKLPLSFGVGIGGMAAFITILPICYLYTIRKLLIELKKTKK
jgi:hypothetical protein